MIEVYEIYKPYWSSWNYKCTKYAIGRFALWKSHSILKLILQGNFWGLKRSNSGQTDLYFLVFGWHSLQLLFTNFIVYSFTLFYSPLFMRKFILSVCWRTASANSLTDSKEAKSRGRNITEPVVNPWSRRLATNLTPSSVLRQPEMEEFQSSFFTFKSVEM